MAKLVLYYYVDNPWDNSVNVRFFEDESVAKWYEDKLSIPLGNSGVKSITVEGSNLSCEEAISIPGHYLELLLGKSDEEQAKEFAKEFFPEGIPENFEVWILNDKYYEIFFEGRQVFKVGSSENTTDKGCEILSARLETFRESEYEL